MDNSEKYGKTLFTFNAQNCQESRYWVVCSLNCGKVELFVPLPLPYFGTLLLLWVSIYSL